jgi:nitrous oxide reductase accessory protein NosL
MGILGIRLTTLLHPVCSFPQVHSRLRLLFALLITPILLAGCGGSEDTSRAAPAAAEFPSAKGKTIADLLHDPGAKPSKLVIAPAAQTFDRGENRYPFGVFTLSREQVDDADVALYFAKDAKGPVEGPLPAQVTSLETKPAYQAQDAGAPGEATTVYVVPKVDFDRNGPWLAIAMLKGKDGLEVSRITATPVVGEFPRIPQVGGKAPVIHTPTAADVGGDMAKIDTRVPPDQMHAVDFADAVGRKPIVLVFATPALCQSRVCGPVVDVAQQVADAYGDEADFIHMEIWNDNDISKGPRPQVQAYNLETEPWTFLIDRNGIVRDRIEGAFGVSELEEAMRTIVPG